MCIFNGLCQNRLLVCILIVLPLGLANAAVDEEAKMKELHEKRVKPLQRMSLDQLAKIAAEDLEWDPLFKDFVGDPRFNFGWGVGRELFEVRSVGDPAEGVKEIPVEALIEYVRKLAAFLLLTERDPLKAWDWITKRKEIRSPTVFDLSLIHI